MATSTPRRHTWREAAIVGIAANVASAVPAGYNGDESFYESLRTPPGAPPGWVFAPVWAANNISTLYSNLRVANSVNAGVDRRRALRAEGLNWVLFSSFSFLFFGLRSPILGALNTLAGLVITIHSVRLTSRVDQRAQWALIPRLAWLAFASYVSVATALRSPDELFGYRPRTKRGRRS